VGAFYVYPDEYRSRQPNSNPLCRLLDSLYKEFRDVYDERFSKRYGYWRPVTDEVVHKYLQCGDPQYGFARIRCKECGTEYLRAFSCKCRGFRDISGTAMACPCWFLPFLFEEKVAGPISIFLEEGRTFSSRPCQKLRYYRSTGMDCPNHGSHSEERLKADYILRCLQPGLEGTGTASGG
jgi:hypothetical protein